MPFIVLFWSGVSVESSTHYVYMLARVSEANNQVWTVHDHSLWTYEWESMNPLKTHEWIISRPSMMNTWPNVHHLNIQDCLWTAEFMNIHEHVTFYFMNTPETSRKCITLVHLFSLTSNGHIHKLWKFIKVHDIFMNIHEGYIHAVCMYIFYGQLNVHSDSWQEYSMPYCWPHIITRFAISSFPSHFTLKMVKTRETIANYQLRPYVENILFNFYAPTYSAFIHANKKLMLP